MIEIKRASSGKRQKKEKEKREKKRRKVELEQKRSIRFISRPPAEEQKTDGKRTKTHRDEYLVFHVKVRKVCWCRKLFFRESGEIILNIF